jgi:7-keto-8-aminopelargonate synthetase-like enzyme
LIKDRWVMDFASCNYLGLDLHPKVIAAIPPATQRWGTHPSWTRAVCSPRIYEDMEDELAKTVKAKYVLAFPTITLLHAGVIPALVSLGGTGAELTHEVGDDGLVICDVAAHNCCYEATLLAKAKGATTVILDLNNMAELEQT